MPTLILFSENPQIQTDFSQTTCNLPSKLGTMAGKPRKINISNGRIEKIDPSITMFEFQKREKTFYMAAYACHSNDGT